MKLTRRDALVLTAAASAASFAGVGPVFAKDGDTYDMAKLMQPKGLDDRPIGDENAKVTMIEYASPTCPHCARFAIDVLPEFRKKYVETGKVRFIMRPFVRNVLDAVVFMLAETADTPEQYLDIVDSYFKTQNDWATSDKPKDALLKIALQLGFTQESFDAALTNQELYDGIESVRKQAIDEFDLQGTPTFYINGKQSSGERSLDELAQEIDPLLG